MAHSPGMIRRSGQQWVMDQLFRIAGHDLLFPGALGFRIERGYRYAEVERTMHRVKTFRQNAREWARTAGELEEWALDAEKKGHAVTARDFFYRASIYYGRAQWSINRDTDMKRELYDKCVRAFEGLIRHSRRPDRARHARCRGRDRLRRVASAGEARRESAGDAVLPRHGHVQGGIPQRRVQSVRAARHRDADPRRAGTGRDAGEGLRRHRREIPQSRQGRARLSAAASGDRRRQARGVGRELRLLLGAAARRRRPAREGERRHHGHPLFHDADLRAGAAELQIDLHVYGRHQRRSRVRQDGGHDGPCRRRRQTEMSRP